MNPASVNITLGTAGHIDHGKTALVKLLTGCETDRLKEEKERGMSIELGFAPCLVAGLEVGIVDVPGHEHFIKTMVAGATGMDAVMLVVAADDGLMPQTYEHLDILTLLGVRHGMVALTKIDRVTAERVAEVRASLGELLRGTFLQGATIAPISSVTGEGFDGFITALQALVKSVPPRPAAGVFRLPVERSFSVKGYGTVVAGVPAAGAVRLGDEVVLLPEGLSGRISGIQVYGHDADTAMAGQCAAVNVRQWEAASVGRGSVIALPGYFEPAMWLACRLRLLGHPECALKNASGVKFHVGTSELSGTVYLMEGDWAAPGSECLVQVRLDTPVVTGPRDPFLLRLQSPPMTIGGGRIIETLPGRLKRTHAGIVDDLRARAEAVASDAAFVEYALQTAPAAVTGEADLSRRTKVLPPQVRDILKSLLAAGRALDLGAVGFVHRRRAEESEQSILAAAEAYHKSSPESPGQTPEALFEAAGLARPLGEALVARLVAAGKLAARGGRLAIASHKPAVADQDQRAIDAIERAFLEKLLNPPSPEEAAAGAKLSAPLAAKAVRLLREQQRLVEIAPGLLMHRDAIERARQLLTDYIRKEGFLESVKFKYLLETTRKFAIPLLDYFDRIGVTRASGHTRYLRPQKPKN
jgi:selenocysteine-specific elongation factor